jgi:hypothetical protein
MNQVASGASRYLLASCLSRRWVSEGKAYLAVIRFEVSAALTIQILVFWITWPLVWQVAIIVAEEHTFNSFQGLNENVDTYLPEYKDRNREE